MYPLKFQPILQQRLWGGQRLSALLGKTVGHDLQRACIGESWELADLPAGTVKADSTGAAADGSLASRVTNGPLAGRSLRQLLRTHREAIMGDAPLSRGHFPLLIKFLDARMDLSVQVHPDKAFCAANADAHLKSEAWYILHADPGAIIYKGLKPGVTREVLLAALKTGDVAPLLNAVRVRPGECHYLPSGTLHALGAGILAAEIQTPSDTTFRVFDWNRLGTDGKPRALHIDQALACIDFGDLQARTAPPASRQPPPVAENAEHVMAGDYFAIDRVRLPASTAQEIPAGEPRIWIVLEGQAVINCQDGPPTAFTRGETLLLPAQMNNARVQAVANSAWLEVRLPRAAP